ncbi:MAG: SDR family oxidoreductase [bacterium]|nr:SDR family oxidoreductase [bacterium]
MPQADPLYLLKDGLGIAPLLAAKLEATGIKTQVVDTVPPEAKHLMLMSGLQSETDPEKAQQAIFNIFNQLRSCAAAMSKAGQLLITVQDSGGQFAPVEINQAWGAGISAFARTADWEWPQLAIKAIDLQCGDRDADDLADALFQELVSGGPELEVGLTAAGKRFSLRVERVEPAETLEGSLPLEEGDVLVVSGGARGITPGCLFALAEKRPLRFVLLGRSPLTEEGPETVSLADEAELKKYIIKQSGKSKTPAEINTIVTRILAAREISETVAKLTSLGSQARYMAVDVSDTVAVAKALAIVRGEWGAIQGIIHAAGVVKDRAIVDMTANQFEPVFRAKVQGLHALLTASQEDNLKLFCCFSSLAARVGNPGQLNYNVANETLNKVCIALKAQQPDCIVKSIVWGAWDRGMVTPALKRHFTEFGVELIDPQAGGSAFVSELCTGPSSAVEVILTGDPGKRFSFHKTRTTRQASVWFQEENFPLLNDHVVHQVPVAAMFFIMELAARFVQSNTNNTIRAIRDVKVYKGIQLPHFNKQGAWINVTASSTAKNIEQVEFRDEENRVNYRFTVETGPLMKPPAFTENPESFGCEDWDWNIDRIYTDRLVLFHTGVFKMVKELGRIDKSGFSHRLFPGKLTSDSPRQWCTDALVTDGAAQGTVLWTWWKNQLHTLPTGIKKLHIYQAGLPAQPISCYTRVVKDIPHHKCWFDVWLVDKNGQLVAKMEDLELIYIPPAMIPETRKIQPIHLY